MTGAWDLRPDAILNTIEHTDLRPDAGERAVARLCAEAVRWGLGGVCVHPAYVARAAAELARSGVRLVTVCGFPLGANRSDVKAREAAAAAADGAHEIDMVMNIGRFKEGEDRAVADDIRAVVRAAGIPVKVILECALLTPEEMVRACRLAEAAGARFVKTSTGFGTAGATVAAVQTLRAAVGDRLGVKAAGGIRTLAEARLFLAAGADRIGTSRGADIAAALAAEAPGAEA